MADGVPENVLGVELLESLENKWFVIHVIVFYHNILSREAGYTI